MRCLVVAVLTVPIVLLLNIIKCRPAPHRQAPSRPGDFVPEGNFDEELDLGW